MAGGGGNKLGLRQVADGCPGKWCVSGGDGVIGKFGKPPRDLVGWRPRFKKWVAGGGGPL